jgi:hypothetical protein
VSKESLAGYSALTHKLLNIANVYDDIGVGGHR